MLIPLLVVLLAGAALATQAPTNAALAREAGSVTLAALASFTIGTAALALAWAVADRTPLTTIRAAPWWAWLGGLYGAAFVAAMAYAAPRLGIATTLTVAIGSQVAAAIVIDHVGLFGVKAEPAGLARLAGAALVIAGVALVQRG